MYITLTAEEKQHINDIRREYAQELTDIKERLDNAEDKEAAKPLLHEQLVLWGKVRNNIDAYMDKIQRARFAQIEGGTAGIIENAKQQADIILKTLYEETVKDYSENNPEYLPGLLKMLEIGTIKNGKLLLSTNYALETIESELKLHFEALADDVPAQQELLEVLIEAVETSDLTDNTEAIDAQKKPLNIKRFRRSPLSNIKYYGLMNDKINARLLQDADDIFTQTADGQLILRWAVNQASPTHEQVPVYMGLTYKGNDYKVTAKLTAYDKQVYEAVSTRYYYWNLENPQKPLYITPQEIWRTMNGKQGKDGQAKPSPAQVKRICESLDKMRFTLFQMDISKEISAFNLFIDDDRINGGMIETYVLNSSKVIFTTDKGNEVQGYRIGEEPILYTYNKAKNHVLFVPYEMLDTSQYTSDSENVAEFKGYLLQQIQLIKNAAEEGKKGRFFKRNNIILLETIYKDTGITPPENRIDGDFKNEASKQAVIRRMKKADREKIKGLLDAWKAKGWIKGYTVLNKDNEPVKEKQQAKGYRISV